MPFSSYKLKMTKITLMILWQDAANLQKMEFGAIRQPRDAPFQAEPAARAENRVSQISFSTWNSTAEKPQGEEFPRWEHSCFTDPLVLLRCCQGHPGGPCEPCSSGRHLQQFNRLFLSSSVCRYPSASSEGWQDQITPLAHNF